MPNLIVTIGQPGSGKSTDVLRWQRAAPNRMRISRDGLRVECGLGGNHDDNPPWLEHGITLGQHAAVRAWLAAGLDVAIDDTCQAQTTLDAWVRIADEFGARLMVWDYRGVPVPLCVRRDRERGAGGGRLVGEAAIERVAARCAKVVVPDGVMVRVVG